MKKPKSSTLIALLQCLKKAAFLEKNKSTQLLDFVESKKDVFDSSRREVTVSQSSAK
jgi:hypothetical protein